MWELPAHLDCRREAKQDEEETDDNQDDHPGQTEVVLTRDIVGQDGGVSQPPANLSVSNPLDEVYLGPGGGVEVVASGEEVVHHQRLKHHR